MGSPFRVSNPFRTGRYCAVIWTTYQVKMLKMFQTPSERGGIVLVLGGASVSVLLIVSNPFRTGRYCADTAMPSTTILTDSFKPLQNGAVLCCDFYVADGQTVSISFQTPSERGGIVLTGPGRVVH